ncbi:hypothetical protein VTN00DRAFT_5239 [Thermoascus crustaceus]|uniref:uncharacterized protein n=1 Tax=Thermoascus crustaceus TaxID=5088 RepID=UPI0037448F27
MERTKRCFSGHWRLFYPGFQWLARNKNSKWLLIFDNIDQYLATDDPDGESYDITEFFPSADHGSIIITTRLP